MSYVTDYGVTVVCKANPHYVYANYKDNIEEAIKADGYQPETSMEHLITMVVLAFDCDDNYGDYDPKTGCGGYGNEFSMEECLRYVDDCGGWQEFDYQP